MKDESRIPDWLLERVALDEVPAGLRADLEHRLAADPSAADRLTALAESDRAILAAHPPARVAAEVERRRRARAVVVTSRRYRLAGIAMAAAAVALFLVIRPGGQRGADHAVVTDRGQAAGSSERVKGGHPYLRIHRQRGAGSERLIPEQRVTAGDRLQLSYVAGGARYGVILSIDGRGVVTVHFPEPETGDTALAERRKPVFLAHSYRLDDAPGFERFFLVTSEDPISVAAVRAAAERLASQPGQAERGTLGLDPDLEQSSFLLRKASR